MSAEQTWTRRRVIKMAGAAGATAATVTFVSACGGGEDSGSGPGESDGASNAEIQQAVQTAVGAGAVPVGGGHVLEDVGVVVTQPQAGDYKVFSTYCPHQGGRVSMIDEASGRPVCVLHGSAFDPVTGDVVVGPSPTGLEQKDVSITAPSA